MRLYISLKILVATACYALCRSEDECTTIVVGSKASSNGGPMTTHTNDCKNCDFRISKVQQKTFQPHDKHDVILAKKTYPQYVGTEYGETFTIENVDTSIRNWTETKAIGHIPQGSSTFTYVNGLYGIMNEHQLAIGESTCGARFISKPVSAGGQALLDIRELTRLAMARTKTAREAIQLMGDIAVKYGYYGNGWDSDKPYSESGEALTVVDTTEAWVFHVLPDDTGASALWVSQRVPDEHIAVVANQFVIHRINLSDSNMYMGSSNLKEVAIRSQLWNTSSTKQFDFTNAFALPRGDAGNASNTKQYYSTRRVWRVLTLANPSLKLSPFTDTFATDYPFSVPVTTPISPLQLMEMQRDHYEGTPFDMTKGPSGGPYGNPDRYDVGENGNISVEEAKLGQFERAISIFRATYTFVTVCDHQNSNNAHIWFGQYAPHCTSYTPIFVQSNQIPVQYTVGSLYKYDQNAFFWLNLMIGNWVNRFYEYAIVYVKKFQQEHEKRIYDNLQMVQIMASRVESVKGIAGLQDYLSDVQKKLAAEVHADAVQLLESLIVMFHDGYKIEVLPKTAELQVSPLFYPKWWLESVGYFKPLKTETEHEPSDVVFGTTKQCNGNSVNNVPTWVLLLVNSAIFLNIGYIIGRRYHHRFSYEGIN